MMLEQLGTYTHKKKQNKFVSYLILDKKKFQGNLKVCDIKIGKDFLHETQKYKNKQKHLMLLTF